MRTIQPTRIQRARDRADWLPLLACIVIMTGCSSHRPVDDLTGPGSTSDPLGEGAAREQGLQALDIVIELVEVLPEWRAGELSGIGAAFTPPGASTAGSTEPVWSEAEKSWLFSDSLVFASELQFTRWSFGYAVRYDRGTTGQRGHEDADGMRVRLNLVEDGHGQSAPGEDEFTLDYHYRYGFTGRFTYPAGATPRYIGSGLLEGESHFVSMTSASHRAYEAVYHLDVGFGSGGCASGTATFELEPYTMTATFPGNGTVSWTLRRNLTTLATGSKSVACT